MERMKVEMLILPINAMQCKDGKRKGEAIRYSDAGRDAQRGLSSRA